MAPRRLTTKTAWIIAIAASLLAIATGPVTQQFLTPMQSEPVHYVATYIMLGAVVFLMVVLVLDRRASVARADVRLSDSSLTVIPCEQDQVFRMDQAAVDRFLETGHLQKPTQSLRDCQVVALAGLILPEKIAELWPLLPQMRVLDVSNATLPRRFWQGLENCPLLDHVIAHQVVDPASAKEVYMCIPEIRVHSNKMSLDIQS